MPVMDHASAAFDENVLRAEIVARWGEHGAHADVYDQVLKLARSCDLDTMQENDRLRAALTKFVDAFGASTSLPFETSREEHAAVITAWLEAKELLRVH